MKKTCTTYIEAFSTTGIVKYENFDQQYEETFINHTKTAERQLGITETQTNAGTEIK